MKGISTASNRLNPFRVHHLYTLRFVLSISHFKNHLLEKKTHRTWIKIPGRISYWIVILIENLYPRIMFECHVSEFL